MTRRTLPLWLALAALAADVADAHALAFYALLTGIPAAAATALGAFGELVETPGRARGVTIKRTQAALALLGLALFVVAAAARAPSLLDSSVPALGASALIGGLGAFVLYALTTVPRSLER